MTWRALFLVLSVALTSCADSWSRKLPDDAAKIQIVNPVSFVDATGLSVATRIAFPTAGNRLPVVLFSHGAYSSKDEYNLILDFWAAHGYVVIAPTHRDSTSLGVARGSNDPRRFVWRLDDMALLSAQLEQLAAKVPALAGRVDLTKVVAAGHSFGGLIAQTLGGATYFDPAAGKTVSRHDARIKAVIIFSGAGRLPPLLRAEDFATLLVPTLVTVGTEDLKQSAISGYRWRREPYDLIPAENRYLLVLQGADHYLGGLVCRDDLPHAAQGPQWLSLFNEVTLAFMDAALQRDSSAPRRLAQLLDRTAHAKNGIARTWHRDAVQD